MKNISDYQVIIVILLTIFVVFAIVFSVKSPERKVIESPIIWKEDFSNISIIYNESIELKNSFFA